MTLTTSDWYPDRIYNLTPTHRAFHRAVCDHVLHISVSRNYDQTHCRSVAAAPKTIEAHLPSEAHDVSQVSTFPSRV